MRPRRLEILAQPDNTTCGPTCLHAVYRYYGLEYDIHQLIKEVPSLENGGTLGVLLANHALRTGFEATIYTYNLNIFDPTWFQGDVDLVARLREQAQARSEPKLRAASLAYAEFLSRGGTLCYEDLTPALWRRYLDQERPILTGLSATYLFGCAREYADEYDDVRGSPSGHFVVLTDYNAEEDRLIVADPLRDNPGFDSQYYEVETTRVMNAILLGIVTYDANLLIIEPRKLGAP